MISKLTKIKESPKGWQNLAGGVTPGNGWGKEKVPKV